MKNALIQPRALILAAATCLLLIACSTSGSHPMDAGERMSDRGGAISARGEAWTDGKQNLQKGQRLVERSADRTADGEKKLKRAQQAVAKAERQIQTARADRTNGEQLISSGTTQMQQAESAYAEIRNRPSAIEPR